MPWTITEIHPLIVHFPIALFSTGLLSDLLARLFQKDELETVGFWLMLTALISSPFAIISGLIVFFEEGSFLDLLQFQHGLLEVSAFFLFAALFWVRIQFQMAFRYSTLKSNIYILLHCLVVGILFYGAHLGAKTTGRV